MRRPAAFAALVCLLGAGCGSSATSRQPAAPPRAARSTPASTTAPAGTASTNTAPTSTPATSIGFEGIPLEAGAPLAPATSTAQGATVDGIRCAPSEQVAYHIHAHLQVFVHGLPRSLPGGIGMVGAVAEQTAYGPFYGATGCYYWLHTHTNDGVIHIESPSQRIYTLGDFFDEWRQPLDRSRAAGAAGAVVATVNGKPWRRDPRSIPLTPHLDIQLAVGQPVPPFQPVDWSRSRL